MLDERWLGRRGRALPRLVMLALLAATGCTRAVGPLVSPGRSAVALSGGPNTSMTFVARADDGRVLAIDLGWWGATDAVGQALASIGASPTDVTDVFLTHSHRDHVGAWRLVRASRFHVAAAERGRLVGEAEHAGWIPRVAEWLLPHGGPRARQVALRTFSRDTAFAFGADTLFAYVVPGHTAGTAVYRFRGILFLGDAATYLRRTGFGPARRGYSDDPALAAANLAALWRKLPANSVRYVCTAHAWCAPYSADFLRDASDASDVSDASDASDAGDARDGAVR